ncbi:hypothetical protein DL96DRAFT_1624568, partial [Flagelloscypha sp. PMI_526]
MARIQRQLILLAGFCFIALVTTFGIYSHEDSPYQLSLNRFSLPWKSSSSSLSTISDPLGFGFIYRTFVISLAHRDDRKVDIDKLMTNLEMPNWHYHNGTYSDDPRVGNFMRKVQAQRAEMNDSPDEWVRLPFSWPSDSWSNYTSPVPLYARDLPPAGAELWPDDPAHTSDILNPLMCTFDDFRVQKYKEGEIQWRYLTPQRVATYHSHMSAVRRIVDENARLKIDVSQWPNKTQTHVSLVLEDDVDIESDIEKRMEVILPLLPFNWDILFLGYCWSEETHFPALVGEYIRPSKNQLHPSHMPRCLHAYALSPAGALKVLTHLRHDQYAYGRAVDEAFEWLVWQKRIKAFTTVPPLIIQRKVTKTDISIEGNDLWRESLDRGVLGTTLNG